MILSMALHLDILVLDVFNLTEQFLVARVLEYYGRFSPSGLCPGSSPTRAPAQMRIEDRSPQMLNTQTLSVAHLVRFESLSTLTGSDLAQCEH
jgi:hypothetical protein